MVAAAAAMLDPHTAKEAADLVLSRRVLFHQQLLIPYPARVSLPSQEDSLSEFALIVLHTNESQCPSALTVQLHPPIVHQGSQTQPALNPVIPIYRSAASAPKPPSQELRYAAPV